MREPNSFILRMDKLQTHISAAITNCSNDCSNSDLKERGNTLHLGRRRGRDPRKVDLTSSTVYFQHSHHRSDRGHSLYSLLLTHGIQLLPEHTPYLGITCLVLAQFSPFGNRGSN